ncbi:MAG: hypothetical protein HOD92_12145 [Deltaproteobacteria bacterium]|jgi:type I restriction enzyme, R subunit|nr:hypothetical protein [Deltaproteobacteria bacterium]MBT4525546.1 hypothetical protein [Deltaproteobacteria bacterium]
MSKFTEEKLEQAITKLLDQEGYDPINGETLDRKPEAVLIKDDIKSFLSGRYKEDGITADEIDKIMRKLEGYSSLDLYAKCLS